MSDRQYYDVSYRIVSRGTARLMALNPDEAGKALMYVHRCGSLTPIDTAVEVISVEPADPTVEDPQTATGLAPRDLAILRSVDDVTPVIRTVHHGEPAD